ncbi:MAG: class I SAM-dependent methyltransferase [Myxococcota bacterium]|nr:class I SAM-dependent methyltransferase [Myxococcota bacterium]
MDAIAQFKENAKQGWSTFAPTEMVTGSVAPHLVKFAGVERGNQVLDVGCGTGVVALTAARLGATVTGVDLTPKLLERARENSGIMSLSVTWIEGDAEALPVGDAKFDVVLSQFGHMFAPRPQVTVREMLRVLKPGGTIAFSTWPPELMVGRMLQLTGKYAPPPPPEVSPPPAWGDPNVVRERLGSAVEDLCFARDVMNFQMLSVPHYRAFMETNVGPIAKLVQVLAASDPQKLVAFRREFDELVALYFADNVLRQDFLMTRAVKV